MNEEHYQMIVKQQKTLSESLRENIEFWRDIYCFFKAYIKEFDELFNAVKEKVSK